MNYCLVLLSTFPMVFKNYLQKTHRSDEVCEYQGAHIHTYSSKYLCHALI